LVCGEFTSDEDPTNLTPQFANRCRKAGIRSQGRYNEAIICVVFDFGRPSRKETQANCDISSNKGDDIWSEDIGHFGLADVI